MAILDEEKRKDSQRTCMERLRQLRRAELIGMLRGKPRVSAYKRGGTWRAFTDIESWMIAGIDAKKTVASLPQPIVDHMIRNVRLGRKGFIPMIKKETVIS